MSIDTPQHNQEKNEQKIKLSIKQKFAKLFLTSDIKNPNLRKPLSVVKSALIQNFHDGGFDIEEVNSLFWVYFHDHRDVYIPRHLKGYVAKQSVFVDQLERTFSLDEYLSVVKKIRVELEPFTKKVKNLLDEAKVYARDIVDKNKDTDMYSYFDYECDQEQYRTLAKQKFSELLNSETTIDKICTDVGFESVCKSIGKSREQNNYKDLILFSVVGIHCLDKKNEVYNAFTTKQLSNTFIFQNVKFTLEEFLLIIDQLNFKKYFFDI